MVCLIVFQLHEDDVGEGYRVKGQNIPMSSVGGGELSFFWCFFFTVEYCFIRGRSWVIPIFSSFSDE